MRRTVTTYQFQNLMHDCLTFDEVFAQIMDYIHVQPLGRYKLMIGTDSQVYSQYTRFITGVVIQCEGRGAWSCMRKVTLPRPITQLHEKISIETSLTEEVASLFTKERKQALIHVILPHIEAGATFTMEGHLDIGAQTQNKTKAYVEEMVARIESVGLEAKIKPDSYVASAYANRYTK